MMPENYFMLPGFWPENYFMLPGFWPENYFMLPGFWPENYFMLPEKGDRSHLHPCLLRLWYMLSYKPSHRRAILHL